MQTWYSLHIWKMNRFNKEKNELSEQAKPAKAPAAMALPAIAGRIIVLAADTESGYGIRLYLPRRNGVALEKVEW